MLKEIVLNTETGKKSLANAKTKEEILLKIIAEQEKCMSLKERIALKFDLQEGRLDDVEGILFGFFRSNLTKKDLFIFHEMYFYRHNYNEFKFDKYDDVEHFFNCDKSNFLRSVKKLIDAEWLIKNGNEYRLLYQAPF